MMYGGDVRGLSWDSVDTFRSNKIYLKQYLGTDAIKKKIRKVSTTGKLILLG